MVSHAAHAFVEHRSRVAHQVGGGEATPEVEDAGCHDTARTRHPPHPAHDLIDLRNDIDGEGRDAGIEGCICISHATSVAEFIDDVRMRSVAAGAFEIGLRCVYSDHRTTALGQRYRDHPGAASDIEHPFSCTDPGKIEERTCQAATPTRHKVLVSLRIGCQKKRTANRHREPPSDRLKIAQLASYSFLRFRSIAAQHQSLPADRSPCQCSDARSPCNLREEFCCRFAAEAATSNNGNKFGCNKAPS